VTFAQTQFSSGNSKTFIKYLFPGPIFAIVVATSLASFRPDAFFIAIPFLILWLCEPILIYWSSQKSVKLILPLGQNEILTYRLYARRTWLLTTIKRIQNL
jgi:cyclic beta-1,2-glucan synthetase